MTSTYWDFYGFIDKSMVKLTGINYLLYAGWTYNNMQHYEDLCGDAFLPTTVTNILCSFVVTINNGVYVDLPRFIAFKRLASQASNGTVLFSNEGPTTVNYNTLHIRKYITAEVARDWLNHIVTCTNLAGVRSLFMNCIIYLADSSDIEINITNPGINANIKNLDRLFYNCVCSVGTHASVTASNVYAIYDLKFFNHFPNVVLVREMFYNTKWSSGLPFNYFNKRYKVYDNLLYYIENDDKTRSKVKITAYSYRKEIIRASGCFLLITWNTKTKANTYNGNPQGTLYNTITYLNATGNTIKTETITSNIIVYSTETSTSAETIYPSYEYTDTLHLHGKFKQGDFEGSGTHPNQTWPISETDPSNYVNSLILPPDILYGCTTTCYIDNMFNQSGRGTTTLTGILPKHLLYTVTSPAGSSPIYNTFLECLVIPNYVGTYALITDGSVKKIYDIYSFVPEEFVTSTTFESYNYGFNFLLHIPEQGTNNNNVYRYTYYTLMMHNSIPKLTKFMQNAFPYTFPTGSEMRTRYTSYINWQTDNKGIHYNIMLDCTEHTNPGSVSSLSTIYPSDIYNNDRSACKLYSSIKDGFDFDYFTVCRADNMFTSSNMLMIYFGNLFNESLLISSLIYNTTGTYCIVPSESDVNIYTTNSLSCNITFPQSNSRTATRFLKFASASQLSDVKYRINQAQFKNQDSIDTYKAMFSSSIVVTTGTPAGHKDWLL